MLGRNSRGDTLIEVLFAISIFSLIAVGGLAIMNQGAAASERALEITLVRNEIDAQADALRFLNASYIAAYHPGISNYTVGTPASQWKSMQDSVVGTGALTARLVDVDITGLSCLKPPSGSFILDARSATFISMANNINKFRLAQTFSQVVYVGQVSWVDGIWIQAVRSTTVVGNNQGNAGYIDFNIRTCWDSPGQSVPVTIGTIVRLYEPR